MSTSILIFIAIKMLNSGYLCYSIKNKKWKPNMNAINDETVDKLSKIRQDALSALNSFNRDIYGSVNKKMKFHLSALGKVPSDEYVDMASIEKMKSDAVKISKITEKDDRIVLLVANVVAYCNKSIKEIGFSDAISSLSGVISNELENLNACNPNNNIREIDSFLKDFNLIMPESEAADHLFDQVNTLKIALKSVQSEMYEVERRQVDADNADDDSFEERENLHLSKNDLGDAIDFAKEQVVESVRAMHFFKEDFKKSHSFNNDAVLNNDHEIGNYTSRMAYVN